MRRRGAAALLVLLLSAACVTDRATPRPTTAADPDAVLLDGLCQTRAQASEPDAARRTFFDRAHQPLHELAADAARTDRPAAARLLEAKEAVERDFAGDAGPLVADLDRLLEATRRAVAAAGRSSAKPCPETP